MILPQPIEASNLDMYRGFVRALEEVEKRRNLAISFLSNDDQLQLFQGGLVKPGYLRTYVQQAGLARPVSDEERERRKNIFNISAIELGASAHGLPMQLGCRCAPIRLDTCYDFTSSIKTTLHKTGLGDPDPCLNPSLLSRC